MPNPDPTSPGDGARPPDGCRGREASQSGYRIIAATNHDLADRPTSGDNRGSHHAAKLIEVKTTGLGKFFPFYVTANEVRCSDDMAEKYHLFRVFDFGRSPRVYILTESLRANCRLEPTQ
jgi:hypothetical protein